MLTEALKVSEALRFGSLIQPTSVFSGTLSHRVRQSIQLCQFKWWFTIDDSVIRTSIFVKDIIILCKDTKILIKSNHLFCTVKELRSFHMKIGKFHLKYLTVLDSSTEDESNPYYLSSPNVVCVPVFQWTPISVRSVNRTSVLQWALTEYFRCSQRSRCQWNQCVSDIGDSVVSVPLSTLPV